MQGVFSNGDSSEATCNQERIGEGACWEKEGSSADVQWHAYITAHVTWKWPHIIMVWTLGQCSGIWIKGIFAFGFMLDSPSFRFGLFFIFYSALHFWVDAYFYFWIYWCCFFPPKFHRFIFFFLHSPLLSLHFLQGSWLQFLPTFHPSPPTPHRSNAVQRWSSTLHLF